MSSIKIRTKRKDGTTQIRTLISHPMETGRRKDKESDQLVPAHYIRDLVVKHNDKVIVTTVMGASISKNPYFAFLLKGGEQGDRISISWKDNLGNTDNEETVLK